MTPMATFYETINIEQQIIYRKGAKGAEMIGLLFFAAETPAKNAHALRAESCTYKEHTRSVGCFPFLSSHLLPWRLPEQL